MATELDRELKTLLVGTNDLRRRAGQAFYHFYKTLIFWSDKGLSFIESARVWMPAGAAIFNLTASSLRAIGDPSRDESLRGFCATLMRQLADDLERGDHTRIAHVRWLEARFPELTEMMRRDQGADPIYDSELATMVANAFTLAAGGDETQLTVTLRGAADEIEG